MTTILKSLRFRWKPCCLIDMTKHEMEAQQIAQEFWAMVEKEAAELEVTVDYYLEEFFCS